MNLHNFKKIGIIGFAREGRSLLNYLESIDFKGEVFIMDRDISLEYPDTFLNVSLLLGQTYLNSLDQVDLVFKSAGVPYRLPEIQEVIKKGIEVTSIVNLFFSINKKPVIAVSGTKGKSSTVTFINDVLTRAGFKSQLIGNIGNPVLDYLDQDIDYFVFEISSYMLETFNGCIDYGVFTSFFPDHMDTHGSFENYKKAKFRFFDVCKKLFINDKSLEVKDYLLSNNVNYISFQNSDVSFESKNLIVKGESFQINCNLGAEILNNFVGAISCLLDLGIELEFVIDSINHFIKLPHRQEVIVSKDGLKFVNDSASITPESTIAAINNFKDDLKVLILGGQNRGSDYCELENLIVKLNIQHVLILPNLNTLDFSFEYTSFENLEGLFDYVKDLNLKSGTILFSPGGASYNLFKNFYERGDKFLSLLNQNFDL